MGRDQLKTIQDKIEMIVSKSHDLHGIDESFRWLSSTISQTLFTRRDKRNTAGLRLRLRSDMSFYRHSR